MLQQVSSSVFLLEMTHVVLAEDSRPTVWHRVSY